MNIILEGNIDFYKELNNIDSDYEDNDDVCLLTNMPLDNNSITLPCNHKFNFFALYKEVINQKNSNNYLEVDKLLGYQIKCPYCRQKCNKLLPHVRLNSEMSYIYGVNSPEGLCMDFHKCNYVFKSGKNKGGSCSKTAFHSDIGCYCTLHTTSIKRKMIKSTTNVVVEDIITCKAILKSGKRKGEECGIKACKDSQYCKRHTCK